MRSRSSRSSSSYEKISPLSEYNAARFPPRTVSPAATTAMSASMSMSMRSPSPPSPPRRASLASSSVRRKPVGGSARPVSPMSELYEYEDGVEIREAAAAGVPFLDLDTIEEGGEPVPGLASPHAWPQETPQWREAARSMGGGSSVVGGGGTPAVPEMSARAEEARLAGGWRPGYLRRRVVASFVAGFIAMLIIIEALHAVDKAQGGLDSGVFVLWAYGPTLILTMVVALWGRLEFQAKRYLPWILLAGKEGKTKPRDASETLLLDYPTMWMPSALLFAARKRHWLVLVTIVVAVLLLIEVVLSTGLFVVDDMTKAIDGVPALVNDQFVLDYARSSPPFGPTPNNEAYLAMLGIASAGIAYPDGYMPGLAYQTFKTANSTTDAPLRMTVDAVSARPECEVASVVRRRRDPDTFGMIVEMESSFCDGGGSEVTLTPDPLEDSDEPYYFAYQPCAGRDSAVLAGVFSMRYNSNATMEYVDSAVVACRVSLYSGRRDVTHIPGSGFNVRQPLDQDKPVEQKFMDAIHHGLGYDGISFENRATDADYMAGSVLPAFRLAAHLNPDGPPTINELLDDGAVLKDMMTEFFRSFGTMAVHRYLRVGNAELSTGTAETTERRLRVSSPVAHLMAVFLGISSLLTGSLIFVVPRRGVTPRNPNSVVGTAILLSKSRELFGRLREADTRSLVSIAGRLRDLYYTTMTPESNKRSFVLKTVRQESFGAAADPAPKAPACRDGYDPHVLWPSIRIGAAVVTATLAALLWGLVTKSNVERGLLDAKGSPHDVIVGTLLVAAIFLLLKLYLGNVDLETRFLAPFAALYTTSGFAAGMTTTYTDELAPVTLYKAARSRTWGVVLTRATVVVAAVAPILVSQLFYVETTTRAWEVRLAQVDWFSGNNLKSKLSSGQHGLLAHLALNREMAYPPWTHEDLVFPRLGLAGGEGDAVSPDVAIEARLPAVMTQLTCAPLEPSDGELSFVGCKLLDAETFLECSMDEDGRYNGFFGHAAKSCQSFSTNETFPGSVHYVWGSCDLDGLSIQHRSIISCNETIVAVDVDVELRNTERTGLAISKEPLLGRGTERSTNLVLPIETDMYQLSADFELNTGNLTADNWGYDAFFRSLMTPGARYTIPLSSLSSAEGIPLVTSAIQRQHALIRAQMISASREAITGEDTPTLSAAQLRPSRRIVLRSAPGYLLAVVLTLVFLASAAGVVVAPGRVVPCSPGSIAAVAGMLSSWQFLEWVPDGAEWMGGEELRRYFGGGGSSGTGSGAGASSGSGGLGTGEVGIRLRRILHL